MHRAIRAAIAICGATLAGPSAQAASQAAPTDSRSRGELIVNFVFTESYTRKYDHNPDHASTVETMSFQGTVRRPYAVTITNGQLADFSELSPGEAKQANVQPSGGGSLQYNATDTLNSPNGSIIAKKTFSGAFGNDAVAASLFGNGDGTFTIRTMLHAANLSGSCSLASKTANSNDCSGVPLAGMGPEIGATGPNAAKFDWNADVTSGAAPKGTFQSADPMVGYMIDLPNYGMQMKPDSPGNYSLSFHKIWQFQKNDAASGRRAAKKTLDVQAVLQTRDVKCTLTDAMVKAAYTQLASEQEGDTPLVNFRSQSAGGNTINFVFGVNSLPGVTQGFLITGSATLSNNNIYRVNAALTHEGGDVPGRPSSQTGTGCDVDTSQAPGLNAAFVAAISPMVQNALNGKY